MSEQANPVEIPKPEAVRSRIETLTTELKNLKRLLKLSEDVHGKPPPSPEQSNG